MNQNKFRLRLHPKNEVSVNLSSPQQSGLGEIIGKMYYNTRISELLGDLSSGYPHNGGIHSLYMKGPYLDIIAGIELIRDQTPVRFHPTIVEAKMELTMLCNQIRMSVESKK